MVCRRIIQSVQLEMNVVNRQNSTNFPTERIERRIWHMGTPERLKSLCIMPTDPPLAKTCRHPTPRIRLPCKSIIWNTTHRSIGP